MDLDELTDLEQLAAEQNEQRILLDKGLEFKTGGRFHTIKQPYLGTLDYLAAEFIRLDVDRAKLEAGPLEVFEEQKRVMAVNVKRMSRIVAIAVLNHWLLIWPFYRVVALYYKWTVTPSDLLKLTSIVLKASNLSDFTSSTVLMSVNRVTSPTTVED